MSKTQRTIVLVTGMHRSGTSYVSSLCQAFGLCHAERQLQGNVWNVPGYFEAQETFGAHEALMSALQRPWWDVTPWPENWTQLPPSRDCVSRLVAFVENELSEGDAVVKDPRASLLLPLWREVCQEANVRLAILVCMRPAGEVAGSLLLRSDVSALVGVALWWRYTTAIWRELSAAPLPHAFVFYHDTLAEPASLHGALKSLDVRVGPLASDKRASVKALPKPDLRHHTSAPPAVAKDALLGVCDEIYDRIRSEPIVPPGAPDLPGSDLMRRLLGWYPHWRSLFMRHDQLLQRTRNVYDILTRIEAIGGPHR